MACYDAAEATVICSSQNNEENSLAGCQLSSWKFRGERMLMEYLARKSLIIAKEGARKFLLCIRHWMFDSPVCNRSEFTLLSQLSF